MLPCNCRRWLVDYRNGMDERDSHCPYLLSSETTANGTGLAESAWKEDPVELECWARPTKRCLNGGMLEWPHVTITTVIANVYCGQYGNRDGVRPWRTSCSAVIGWREIAPSLCSKTGPGNFTCSISGDSLRLLATTSAALQRHVHTAATFPLRRSKTVSLQIVARQIFFLNWA